MEYAVEHAPGLAPALEERFAARVAAGRTPSSAYALFTPHGVVAAGGVADTAVTPTPTPDTAFRIASCTKSFTAAAMLQLRDAGLLDLDAPVDSIVPLAVVPGGRMPTVAELASMSAGFPTDDPWGDRQESLERGAFDAMATAGFRLVDRPGTRFEYSNLGFALLGRVLERVSGRPYPELVRERLLEPLGIRGLAYDRSVDAPDGIAEGFARVGTAWERQPWAEPGAFSPIGGMVATPRALAVWAGWLAAAFAADAADDVLAATSRRELQAPRVPTGRPASYGYGLFVEEDPRHGTVVSHSGGYPGYGAHMRWHPVSGIGVIVLENGRYSGAFRPATEVLTEALDALAVPDALPDLWPETLAARETVERLLRRWDDAAADALLAENVAMDEPLERRRSYLAELASRVALTPAAPVADLLAAAPASDSAAHLVWRVHGPAGVLRCEIRLTPERAPRVQTLRVALG